MAYFREERLARLLGRVRVVIFDMDGLIVDNEILQFEATNKVLSPYKIKLTTDDWIKKCLGRRAKEFFRDIVSENSISLKEGLEDLVERKNRYYQQLVSRRIDDIVRPGVVEFIDFLYGKYKLALATCAGRIETEAVIGKRGLGIMDKFEVIIMGDEVEYPKPDPQIYKLVADKMKISPSSCLVLEDTAIGVEAARGAGMFVVAVPNRYTKNQDFSRANYVVTDLTPEARIINLK